MADGYISAVLRSLGAPIPLLSWVMLSAVFTLSGAFGSDGRLPLVPRLGFWLVIVGLALAFGIALRVAIQRLRPGIGYLAASAAAAVTAGILMAVVLPPVAVALLGGPLERMPGFAAIAVLVASLGCGIALLRDLLNREAAAPPAAVARPPPRLAARLPAEIVGRILHLSVSDHYVEVATDRGAGRILMRFADALDEIAGVPGERVHRSHWVAHEAVAEVRRAGGRTFLVLVNGTEVPVSRAYREAVDRFRTG